MPTLIFDQVGLRETLKLISETVVLFLRANSRGNGILSVCPIGLIDQKFIVNFLPLYLCKNPRKTLIYFSN